LSGQGASVAVIFIAFVRFVFVPVKTLHSKHVRTGDVFVIYGMAYLGTQGDIRDDHKDSGLATLGSWIVALVMAAVHAALNRDFVREWKDSLTVKHSEPLGGSLDRTEARRTSAW